MQLVNVRTLKIVELLTFKAEDLVAHDHADMDAFAVEYIAVHDRRPLERPPQQRLRLLDGESETNRPQGYFPFAFTFLEGPSRRPDAMQKKRRNGQILTKTSVEDEIAHLRGLDLKGLRARWHGVFQRQAPAHLTRHLLFAVIAYRIQADRLGDLDHETRQVLDRTV